MFDTARIIKQGINGVSFTIKSDYFKKKLNERNEIVSYYNTFETKNGSKLYVEYSKDKNNTLIFNFSIPKVANGSQLETLSVSDKFKTIDAIYECIKDKIDIDIGSMKVSRIDIANNLSLKDGVSVAINELNYNYSPFRNYQKAHFKNESLTIYNKSKRIVFYDKVKEQKDMNETIPKEFENKNILRYETQNKHSKDVKDVFGIGLSLEQLFQDKVFECAKHYQAKRFKFWYMKNKSNASMYSNDIELIELLKQDTKRNLVFKYIAVKYLETQEANFDIMKAVFDGTFQGKNKRKEFKKIQSLTSYKVENSKDIVVDIYEQLKNYSLSA